MTDPNVTTTPEGEIILEPGDPGYVDPAAPPAAEPEPAAEEAAAEDAPAGADLTFQQQPGETDAEFAARTRGVAVVSQSPTDIVPNTPQITMGAQVPVEGHEGELVTSGGEPEPEPEVVEEGEAPTEEPAP